MSNPKQNLSQQEMLQNLLRSMQDDSLPKEQLDEDLKSLGYDPKTLASKGTETVLRLQSKLRLEQARERRKLLDKARELLAQLRTATDPNAVASAMKLMTGGQPQYAGFFSKVKDLSEEDSKQVIEDADLLKILDSLESDDAR